MAERSRVVVRNIPVLLIASVALGCAGDDGAAPAALEATVTDSAGIVVVSNQRPPGDSRMVWVVDSAPRVSIGSLAGDDAYALFQVGGATRLADGRLAVANGGTSEVRLYDADGRHVRSIGGAGEGPGEFAGLGAVARWPGDSIMAWDWRQRGYSVFDGTGALGRTVTLEQSDEVPFPQFRGAMEDGSILVTGGPMFGPGDDAESGLLRQDQSFLVVGGDGSIVGSLGDHPGTEAYMIVTGDMVSISTHPFARSSRAAVLDGSVVVGTTDSYQLGIYDLDGNLRRIVRRDHALVPVTEEDLASKIAERREEMTEEEWRRMSRLYADMPLVPTFPAFGPIHVDPLGYLWVAEYPLPGDASGRWTVFDPDGTVQGMVETPPDLTVFEIGEDYVLGVETDELDVEYVRLYGLDRSGRAAEPDGP